MNALPWHVGPHYKSDIESLEGRVAECRPLGTPRSEANAAFIVRACNAHDGLVDALKAVLRFGELAAIDRGAPYPPGGKKPATQDVWQFPRHLLTTIEAAIASAEERS